MSVIINDVSLSRARKQIEQVLSELRFKHTLEVEKMAVRIGEMYCSRDIDALRAAALLHDVTKELMAQEQADIFKRYGIVMDWDTEHSPSTQHGVTAAMIIPEMYPELADERVISSVRCHTTGKENMTVFEKIIYLADYIEETRTYSSCRELRNDFWSANIAAMSDDERLQHLDRIILRSLDMTVMNLIKNGKIVHGQTVRARNCLIAETAKL